VVNNMVCLPSGFPAEQVDEVPAVPGRGPVLPEVTAEALPAVVDLGLERVVREHLVFLLVCSRLPADASNLLV
jgi:hypothetical protein